MVAVVVQSDITQAIPLLDDDGFGVYIKGRNNMAQIRHHLLGGLFSKLFSSPFAYRSGVISPGSHTTGAVTDLKVSQTGGGGGAQSVTVKAGRSVITRTGAAGVWVVTQSSDAVVNAPAADAANPRIDILAMMPYDKGSLPADAVHGPKFIWVTGDPAGVPTIPAIPAAVVDCLPLCRVTRAANDNTIATADIVDMRKSSGIHGVPRYLLGADLLADVGGYHGEMRMRGAGYIDTVYVNAGYTQLEDRWDAVNNTWRGTQSLVLPKPTILNTASLGGNTTFTMATVSLPDPGWPYRVDVSGSILMAIVGGASTSLAGVYIQFNKNSTSFTPAAADLIRRTVGPTVASPKMLDVAGRQSTVLTGANSISFVIRNESSPSNFITWDDNAYAHCSTTVHPA